MALTREALQAQIPRRYRWYVHVSLDLLYAGAAIAFALSRIRNLHWAELLALPIGFLAANAGEYLLHKYPMHRPMFPRFIYQRHAVSHHAFYTHDRMGIDSLRDLRWVLFPAYTVPLLIALMLPIAAAVGVLISANAGWLTLVVTAGYYVLYEFLHTTYHLPPTSWLGRRRTIGFLRRLHQTHHDPRLMRRWNFNITFPICDAIFRTWYREPGAAAARAALPVRVR